MRTLQRILHCTGSTKAKPARPRIPKPKSYVPGMVGRKRMVKFQPVAITTRSKITVENSEETIAKKKVKPTKKYESTPILQAKQNEKSNVDDLFASVMPLATTDTPESESEGEGVSTDPAEGKSKMSSLKYAFKLKSMFGIRNMGKKGKNRSGEDISAGILVPMRSRQSSRADSLETPAQTAKERPQTPQSPQPTIAAQEIRQVDGHALVLSLLDRENQGLMISALLSSKGQQITLEISREEVQSYAIEMNLQSDSQSFRTEFLRRCQLRGNVLSLSRMEYTTCPCVFRSGLSLLGMRFLVSIRKSKSNALLINAFQVKTNVEHRVVLSESEVMALMPKPVNGRMSKAWYIRLIIDTNTCPCPQ